MTTGNAMLGREHYTHEELIEKFGYDPTLGDHRTDDPNVWGLFDVALGRTPSSPTTIYTISGDSASSVVGILTSQGDLLVKAQPRKGHRIAIGILHDVLPAPLEPTNELETVWSGSEPEPEQPVELEDGTTELRQGRSRGLLLGDYLVRDTFTESETEMKKNRTRYDRPSKLRMAA